MSRPALVLVALLLSLSGCAVYGGGYDYGRPGYSVRYYESYPPPRVYYYGDDRNYRWHRDRYEDRRHSHYAPGYDGRYQWHDQHGRYERQRQQAPRYVHPPRYQGWQHPAQPSRQQSWKLNGGREYSRERRHERSWEQKGRQRSSPDNRQLRGWSISR